MNKKEKKPRIRFKGFTDPWEQRKLGEITKITIGEFVIRTKQNPGSPYPVYNGGVSYTGFYDEYNNESNKVIVSARGANAGFVNIVKCRYWAGNSCYSIDLNNKNDYDIDFIFQYMKQNQYKFLENQQAANIPSVSKSDVEKFIIKVPKNIEQQKIGQYFETLDNLITLHQRKYDKLVNIKKAMLEKMFPKNGSNVPEIRFEGFTDPWEQRKLGEIATFINGRAYSQSELLDSGKYKILRVGNFYTNDKWYYSDLELADKYYANKGDLLYTWSATFGPHIWLGNRVIYHYHIWKIELSEKLNKEFAVQILEQDKSNLLSTHNGSTMIHITKKDMEEKIVKIPTIAEQQKIGQYFETLDNLITLHQRKLEKLQNIKKSLLEKMFV